MQTSSCAHDLVRFGFDSFREAFSPHAARGLFPARVVAEHRGAYVVVTTNGELDAQITGRLRHDAQSRLDLPAVGDWLAVDEQARIQAILPRRTLLVRGAAGTGGEPQIVGANVDRVAVVCAFGEDFNPRRIERYLAFVRASGADPLVVLSKCDRREREDVDAVRAFGAEVLIVSAHAGVGVDDVRAAARGCTIAFVGSSGAGKSTLVNAVAGTEQRTLSVASDGRGRHTTTHRELFATSDGGVVLDTPGMRELRLWADDEIVDETFSDVAGLAERCRFRDCTHDGEPGCAVRDALDRGDLSEARFGSYEKLRREARAFEIRSDTRRAVEARRAIKVFARAARVRDRERRR